MVHTTRYRVTKSIAVVIFVILLALPYFLSHRSLAPVASTRSGQYGFTLTDITGRANLSFVHQNPQFDPRLGNIMPHIAALGASIAVADVNNDGWQDLYATSSRHGARNHLYLNQQDGTFREIGTSAGLADVNRQDTGVSMGSVWGDYDNDGDEDVFLYKWGYQRLFRNNGDLTFTDVTDQAELGQWMNAGSAVWFDFDRDGLLDLYIGGYFPKQHNLWNVTTTRIMQESFEYANNGGHNYLYRNMGTGRFADVTAQTGADCTRWTLSVGAADLNGDGWPDLYLANDYGPEVLLINRRGVSFEQARDATLEETSKSGMNVAFGDVFNDGRHDVYVTNISKRGHLFQGNNLRRNLLSETGQLINIADGETADAGWGWGAQFGDLNNDGFVDLYVANGFISADLEKDYWYDMSKVAMGNRNIFQDVDNWAPMGNRSLSGYERSKLFLNNQTGEFFDVAAAVGVTDTYDGRGVALADLFNRGVLDVIVANHKGPLVLYSNTVDPEHGWVAFHLKGTVSNRSAIGAEVLVWWNDQQQIRVVTGGSGFASQSQRPLHFGLGKNPVLHRVEIRWPSGKTQTIEDLQKNRLHTVIEPDTES